MASAPATVKSRFQARVGFAPGAGLLVAIVLTLMPLEAGAARWQGDVIVVHDHTAGRRWGPIVEAQVNALNAALPSGAPRFVYEDAGQLPCDEIPREPGAIRVCSTKRLSRPAATATTRRKETIREALIVLRQDEIRLGRNRVCHELMHAVTATADAYGTEPQSCVRGSLSTFGAWDIALLTDEYE